MTQETNPLDQICDEINPLDAILESVKVKPEQEYKLDPQTIIWSITCPQSIIKDCNQAFVDASGYSREELIGQPHKIIRHPDMPKGAFKDLWDTLDQNRIWQGVVKNKRKNGCIDGDFYWVYAIAMPLHNNGILNGYLSVRLPASRDQRESVEQLYKDLCEEELETGLVSEIPKDPEPEKTRVTLYKNLGILMITAFGGGALAYLDKLSTGVIIFLMLLIAWSANNIRKMTLIDDDNSDLAVTLRDLAKRSIVSDIRNSAYSDHLLKIKADIARSSAMLGEADFTRNTLDAYRLSINDFALETNEHFIIKKCSFSSKQLEGKSIGRLYGCNITEYLQDYHIESLNRGEVCNGSALIDDKIYYVKSRPIYEGGKINGWLFMLYLSSINDKRSE